MAPARNYENCKGNVGSSSKEYLIKFNQLGKSPQKSYSELYHLNHLHDVTICCRGNVLKAHKIVLASSSLFFREIFEEKPRKHPVILIKHISIQTMRQVLRLMYFDKVVVNSKEINGFHQAATYLRLKSFKCNAKQVRKERVSVSIPQRRVSVSPGSSPSPPSSPTSVLLTTTEGGIYKRFELMLQQLRQEKAEASRRKTLYNEGAAVIDDSSPSVVELGKSLPLKRNWNHASSNSKFSASRVNGELTGIPLYRPPPLVNDEEEEKRFHSRSRLLRAYLLQKTDDNHHNNNKNVIPLTKKARVDAQQKEIVSFYRKIAPKVATTEVGKGNSSGNELEKKTNGIADDDDKLRRRHSHSSDTDTADENDQHIFWKKRKLYFSQARK